MKQTINEMPSSKGLFFCPVHEQYLASVNKTLAQSQFIDPIRQIYVWLSILLALACLLSIPVRLTAQPVPELLVQQTYSASGSGTSGIPAVSINVPAGKNRIMVVAVQVERRHAPADANWPYDPDGTDFRALSAGFTRLMVNGVPTFNRRFSNNNYERDASPNITTQSNHTYTNLITDAMGLTTGINVITFPDMNLPENSGDEMSVIVSVYQNVSQQNPFTFLDSEGRSIFSTTTNFVSASGTAPAPPAGRSANEVLYFFTGRTSQQTTITSSPGWTSNLSTASVITTNTSGAAYPSWATSVTNENDGIAQRVGHRFYTTGNPSISLSRTGSSTIVFGRVELFYMMPLALPGISGTVYRDNNGLVGGIDGGSGGGTWNTANTLWVNAIGANGNVLATAAVNASNGSFTFPEGGSFVEGEIVRFQLSTNQGTIGQPAPPRLLPTGWVTVGESTTGGPSDGATDGEFTLTIGSSSSPNSTTNRFGVVQTISISGTVVNDANNSTTILTAGETGTNAGGLYVYLVDGNNNIAAKSTVAANGTYSVNASPNTVYTLQLSTQNVTMGTSASGLNTVSTHPPAGWVATGEGLNNTDDGFVNGIINIPDNLTSNTGNANFGIQRLPETDSKTYVLTAQPAAGAIYPLNGTGSNPPLMSGSDPEDGIYSGNTGTVRNPQGVRISSLPTNGQLWYNGVQVTSADLNITIFANPSLFSVVFAGSGYTSTSFQYAYVDAARAADPTPATYTISWSQPLPVTLLFFDAIVSGKHVALQWATGREQQNKGFYIQRSADGQTWENIGFQISQAAGGSSNRLDYHFVDAAPLIGKYFYRLLQTDFDGQQRASDVRMIMFAQNNSNSLRIYPNPVSGMMTVEGLDGNSILRMLDLSGRLVLETQYNASKATLDLSQLIDGIYYLQVISGTATRVEKVIKLRD